MPEMTVLKDLLVVMAASVVVVALLHRRNLPAPLGFMLVGVVVGPASLGLIKSQEDVTILAEVGVALLLFTIGLHFSLKELLKMGRLVWGGGSAQVLLTMGIVAGIAWLLGVPKPTIWLIGGLGALSSTAIVLRLLQEQGASTSPAGRLMVGILLLQDLAIVPLMLMIPLLAAEGGRTGTDIGLVLAKATGVIFAILVLARRIFPWILEKVVRERSGELFTLTVLFLALGTAEMAHLAGLSLALGAFLAGIILADTEYSHQILGEITPFRDAFTGLFFVSVGMLLDPDVLVTAPLGLLGTALGIIVIKSVIVGGIALALGLGPRVAIIAGLGLAQIGEFSFLLGQSGLQAGLLAPGFYSQFLAVTILLMGIAPFLLQWAPAIADRVLNGRVPLPPELASLEDGAPIPAHEHEHVIVIGYGVNGHNVARVLRDMSIPVQVVELNPQLVRHARAEGVPVLWGDATRRLVLEKAGIRSARAMVVAIADPAATRQITALAHEIHPDMLLLVRTRYASEMAELFRLGANEVVPEEIETSLELAARVMRTYGAGEWAILRTQAELREDNYAFLLSQEPARRARLSPLMRLLAMEESLEITLAPQDWAAGRTLRELDLPKRTGALVLACLHEDEADIVTPGPETVVEAGATLLLLGRGPDLALATCYLQTGECPQEVVGAHPRIVESPGT